MSLPIHPVSAASPDLPDAEMCELIESISKLGQLVPIVMYRGEILDGRKRIAACLSLGIEPRTVTIPDDTDPAEHAVALNLLRTHYTSIQRAMYAATLSNLANGTNRFQEKKLRESLEEMVGLAIARPISVSQAAGMLKVNETTVHQARKVRPDGAPELIQAVENGKISLYMARKLVREVPKEDQAAKVAALLDAKRYAPAEGEGWMWRRSSFALSIRSASRPRCSNRKSAKANIGDLVIVSAQIETICKRLQRFRRRVREKFRELREGGSRGVPVLSVVKSDHLDHPQ